MLFSVHSTIILTNPFINQAGSYDVITSFVTGPGISVQITHVLKMVLFLVTVCDKHILETILSAFLLSYQCSMKLSVGYLECFESYGKLKFKN